MANRFASLRRISSLLLHSSSSTSSSSRFVLNQSPLIIPPSHNLNLWRFSWSFKALSHGSVNLVIQEGKPKFETREIEPPKKEKWKTKKRLKEQRKREKKKRKMANKRDPRCLGVKGKKKKQKFPTAEARIKHKIEMAKIKEALLVERLKKFEVPKLQGPNIVPEKLTGEERFYMKKMAQKQSNYVPIGRRGVFGGVILNMHLHWKKHETIKVICKPCKPGQVHEYAKEIARLSGGIPIQIIGDDTIIFYRGKNYVQPEIMSPIDTLSKKKALVKSKFEQSLETVRRFIAVSEKELELYYRHIALYGDPNCRNSDSTSINQIKGSNDLGKLPKVEPEIVDSSTYNLSSNHSENETDSEGEELHDKEDDFDDGELSETEVDSMDGDNSFSTLYGDPNCRNSDSSSTSINQIKGSNDPGKLPKVEPEIVDSTTYNFSSDHSETETYSEGEELQDNEVDFDDGELSEIEVDSEDEDNSSSLLTGSDTQSFSRLHTEEFKVSVLFTDVVTVKVIENHEKIAFCSCFLLFPDIF